MTGKNDRNDEKKKKVNPEGSEHPEAKEDTEVDEWEEESFPASDPPANY